MGKNKIAVFRPLDIAVIVLVTCAALLMFAATLSGQAASAVSVMLDKNEVTRLALDRDAVYTVGGNTVEIKDGAARMVYAECPDKLCVRQGAVSRVGESIVCLPQRVAVVVVGDGGLDGVTG